MDEWICERCGGTYDTEEVALDCGWWDWVHGIGVDGIGVDGIGADGIGVDEAARAA